jgi:hypothetical protein
LNYGRQTASESLEQWSTSRAASDFKVSELGLDGVLASLAPGEDTAVSWVRAAAASPVLVNERGSVEPTNEPLATEELTIAIEFAMDEQGPAEVMLPAAALTKEQRGVFHKRLREVCGATVDSKTEGDSIRVWRKKRGPGSVGGGGKARWNPDVCEYLVFVVAKERLTTLDAIDALAKRLHCKPERFAYAGAKDKVTRINRVLNACKWEYHLCTSR